MDHMVYFISDENSTKGKDPNINIICGIHGIKGKTSVNVLVSNYTNKHIKFNKGEYIGCLEPTITDNMPSDQPVTHPTNSVTLQKMMAEQVQWETFNPPCHNLKPNIKFKLKALLKDFALQFAKDKMTIGTTPLTEMTTDTGNSETLPNCNEELPMGKGRDWEIAHSRSHLQQHMQLVCTNHCTS